MTAPKPIGPSDLGVAPNIGAALCYAPCCVGLIVSLVVMVIEKQSRFVRFAAFQSLLLHVALFVVFLVIGLPLQLFSAFLGGLGLIVSLVMWLLGLAAIGLMIVVAMKAYGGEHVELPVLSDLVKQWM
jgi:uncharacterized membrane protein